MASVEEVVGVHKPGSIRRIKLQNFLTYGSVEFEPGPRLNMVVGPNGTGKSTILCAICLGLGGEPKLLGRADDETLFIMHDQHVSLIEIELTPQPGEEVHIFKRKIERGKGGRNGRGASSYYLNDVKVNAKQVRELVTSTYHISLDNLCTFLPQDRVGSFSGFNAQELLIETEKSMSGSGHLYDTHMSLIAMEEDLRKGGNEVETVQGQLKRLEADNERLEREKERMEEREEAVKQLELLEKKFVWVKFDQCREQTQQLKTEKDAAKAKVKEAQEKLAPLQEAHALLVSKKERYDARYKTLDANMKRSKKDMDKQKGKAENHMDELEDTLANLNALDAAQRTAARRIETLEAKVKQCEEQVANMPSQEEVDKAHVQAANDWKKHRPAWDNARKELTRTAGQLRDLQENKGHSLSKLAKMNDEKARRKEKIFRQFPDLDKISQWLGQHKTEFRRPVCGPIVCEVTTKTANAAAFLEYHVPTSTLKSFVVECKEDQDLLYREIRGKLKCPINIITLQNNGKLMPMQREYSPNKFRTLKEEHGVIGYLDESFEAPDPVLQALRDNAQVHKVLVGGPKTLDSIDTRGLLEFLAQPEQVGQGLRGSCIIASKNDRSFRYTSSISRYSKKVAMVQDEIRPARLLAPGVNPAAKAKVEAEIEKFHQDLSEVENRQHNEQAREDELRAQVQELQARLKDAKEAQANLRASQTRLVTSKRKLKEAKEEVLSDNVGEKEKLLRKLQARMSSCVTALEAHADQHGKIMKSTFSTAGVRINQDVMAAAERQAHQALIDSQQEFAEIEHEARRIMAEFNVQKSKMRELKDLAEQRAPIMDENKNPLPLKDELEALPVSTIPEIEAAMDEASAKVNGIAANPDVLRQYEERKKEIELIRAQLEELTDSTDSKVHDLAKKKGPWEQALQNAVSQVNELFAGYMSDLGCAGDVHLVQGKEDSGSGEGESSTGNFRDWGIQIRVKFREKSKLQALSARVQSGGERSVSTIMYLMALQDLMVSPFRCVDEINQGLDERNERLVFKRIVENSTKPPPKGDLTNHSGQYFLITPKLLPNLYDMESEAMTVLFIFNGPQNFDHPRDWNTERFIEGAVRAASQVTEEGDDVNEEDHDENSSAGINSDPSTKHKKKRRVS